MRRRNTDSARTRLPMDDAPRGRHESSAPDPTTGARDDRDGDDRPDDGDVLDIAAMLREPGQLPGQRREHFSPDQFFALSRVHRIDVDASDDGMWLTEEPCPKISPDGIHFYSTVFFHPALDRLVDVGKAAPKRNFVVRYNRALLARGVLNEIVILEKDARGGYAERCRCRPKQQFSQIDFNRLIAARERHKKVLLAKIAHAHGLRITLEHGDRALEELRNEQARQARVQRTARHDPVAAAPITANARRDEARRAEANTVEDFSSRVREATGGNGSAPTGEGSRASTRRASSRSAKNSRRRTATPKSASSSTQPTSESAPAREAPSAGSSMVDDDAEVHGDGTTRADSPNSLADYLGAQTGFATEDDE